MKNLCICHWGHSRSVALAREFHKRGQPAVAIGAHSSGDAIAPLSDWADRIFVLQPEYSRCVPESNAHKITVIDVGPDRWVNPYHPELAALLDTMLRERGL